MKFAAIRRFFSLRRVLKGLAGVLVLVALAMAVWMAACILFASYLERRLLPQSAARFGWHLTLGTRSLGISGADFSDIRLDDTNGRKLELDSLRVDYQLGLPIRIRKITVSGLELSVRLQDGVWRIDGLPLDRFVHVPAIPQPHALLPKDDLEKTLTRYLRIEEVRFRQLRLKVQMDSRYVEIPAAGVLKINPDGFEFNLTTAPREQELHLNCLINRERTRMQFNLFGTPDLGRFHPDFLPLGGKAGFSLKGNLTRSLQNDLTGEMTASVKYDGAGTPLAGFGVLKTTQNIQFNWPRDGVLTVKNQGETEPLTFTPSPALQLTSKRPILNTSEFSGGKLTAELKLPRFQFVAGNITGSLTDNSLQLQDGRIRLKSALALQLPGLPLLRAEPISGDFPLLQPEITIPKITMGATHLGKFSAKANLSGSRRTFSGLFEATEFPGLKLRFRGDLPAGNLAAMQLAVDLLPWRSPQPIQPGKYLPALGDELTVNATLSAGFTARYVDGRPLLAGSFMLADGQLDAPDKKLSIRGLEFNCQFADLAALRSAPSQRVAIKKIQFGKFNLSNANFRFQTESLQDILLESGDLEWCGGSIQTRAIRIYQGQRMLRTVIYCDKVNLAQALNELGIANADGEGSVVGKIPIRLSADGLSFENGFLYSEPGHNGTIRIGAGEQVLTQALEGAAAASGAEARLFTEALKDFRYQWAKLKFSTTEEELQVGLQFDGKPAGPLPFVQDQKTGRLQYHVGGKANLQGLQINFNIKLPLNRLLQLNETLLRFKENKQ